MTPTSTEAPAIHGRSMGAALRDSFRLLMQDSFAVVGVAILLIFVVIAIAAPFGLARLQARRSLRDPPGRPRGAAAVWRKVEGAARRCPTDSAAVRACQRPAVKVPLCAPPAQGQVRRQSHLRTRRCR